MSLEKTTIKIAGAAVLAALSIVMQILPPLFITPWGMRIDLVALPWVLCWIFFEFKASILSLLISVPIVGFIGPFAGGWVGAIMKSVASIWMFIVPAFFAWKTGGKKQFLTSKWLYIAVGILAIALRVVITMLFNFYFAIPVFFNMSTEAIISMFSSPQYLSFIGNSLGLIGFGPFVAEIAFWNTIQGTIDVYVSWIISIAVLRRIPSLVKK
jgi:riboflavin transporter FmnP